jgi:hypothetical protein
VVDIDFDQESVLAIHNRGCRCRGRHSPTRRSKEPTVSYSGLSLRASITVKASAAPPRVDGIWLPAWSVSSFKTIEKLAASDRITIVIER